MTTQACTCCWYDDDVQGDAELGLCDTCIDKMEAMDGMDLEDQLDFLMGDDDE